MKKFFSLVLALVMALSLTTAAWGADAVDLAGLKANLTAGEVKLTADININVTDGTQDRLVIAQDLVVDLNGHKLFSADAADDIFYVQDGASLTVKNGTLDSARLGIYSNGSGTDANVIKLDNVKIYSDYFGVYHNGNNYGADVTIENSTITDNGGAGVFLSGSKAWAPNQLSKLTITNSTVQGDTAVEAKYANVTVNNSTLIATGTAGLSANNNGMASSGYALVLTHSGAAGVEEAAKGSITVNSGTITGAVGIQETGGEPVGTAAAEVANTADATIAVKGGTFTDDVEDYVVANSSLVYQNGVYTTTTFVGNTSTLKVADGYAVYELNGGLGTNSATATFTKIVTGNATAADGTVTYTATQYKADNGTVWNEVDVTIADSKLVNTKTGTVVAYLKYAGTSGTKGATSVVATSMVKAPVGTPVCGQYAVDVVMIKGQAYAVDKTATSGQWAVLNGKFITYGAAETAKPHVFTKVNEVNKDSTPANVKCDNCKAVFAVTKDVSAMVSGYVSLGTVAPGYYALIGSTTPVVGGTTTGPVVNSADTFDAGIAMYVGMSVMAAAGSAVVIGKKKD